MNAPRTDFRLVFLTEEYPPDAGGVAVSAARVARGLCASGIEVRVVTFDCSRPLDTPDYCIQGVDGNVGIYRYGPYFTRQPTIKLVSIIERAKAVYRQRVFEAVQMMAQAWQPHVLMSFNLVNAGLIGTYLSRALRIPHISSARGVDVGRNIFSGDDLPILRTIVDGSDAITCVNSHLHRRLLMAFPHVAEKTRVIRNATDVAPENAQARSRQALIERTGWRESDTVAVFLGLPRPKKGIGTLLAAFQLLQGRSDVRLLVIGPAIPTSVPQVGPLAASLINSGKLHCTGFLARNQALTLAATGDIIIMPSLDDGLANGLLEGMALGLAPIATEIFADVLHNGTGIIVPRGDPASLAAAISTYCDNTEGRLMAAARAREVVIREFNPARETAEYLQLISTLAGGQRRQAQPGIA